VVREILLRGDARALQWLRRFLSTRDISNLVRSYAGAGCNERERRRLRRVLRLGHDDIPAGDSAEPDAWPFAIGGSASSG